MLAIMGSPHSDGSTAAMWNCAVEAARRAGWQVEKVELYRKQISYCRGCRACFEAGVCVIKDDIQEIAESLKNCDMVVLAAPTYWANVPAAVKNLFDRLLGVAMEDTARFPKPRLSPKQTYLLLTACNTPFPFSVLCGQSSGTFRAMREFFKTSGMKCRGKVAFSNAHGDNRLPEATAQKIRRFFSAPQSSSGHVGQKPADGNGPPDPVCTNRRNRGQGVG